MANICQVCGKDFVQRQGLTRHIRSVHEFVIDSIINDVFRISNKKTLKNNETPSCKQCDTCGKSYRTNFNLKRHQRQTRLETKFNMILNKSKRYWHMLKEYENKLYNM